MAKQVYMVERVKKLNDGTEARLVVLSGVDRKTAYEYIENAVEKDNVEYVVWKLA